MPNGIGAGTNIWLVVACIHMAVLIKLKNNPGVCTLVEKAAVGWFATTRHQGNAADDEEQERTEQAIREGEVAKAAALKCINWLVTTMNHSIPDETWRVPVPHPCAVNVIDIGNTDDNDYHDIVNMVQRHTRSSAAYCLCKNFGQHELKCHFDYPRPE